MASSLPRQGISLMSMPISFTTSRRVGSPPINCYDRPLDGQHVFQIGEVVTLAM